MCTVAWWWYAGIRPCTLPTYSCTKSFLGSIQDLGWALIGSAWMMAGSVATAACARTMGEPAQGPCYWYVDLFVTSSFWILSIIFASNASSECKFAQHSPEKLPFSYHALQLVLLIEYRTWIQACPSVMAICALGGTAPGTTIKANPWCGKIASQTCAFVRSLHHHSTPLMTATCTRSTAQDLLAFPCLSEPPWCLWKRGCKPIIFKRLWIVPMSQCDSVWLMLAN